MHYVPLSWSTSPCKLLFLNPGVYGLVQATVGVGTVLIWDVCVAYARGGGYLRKRAREASSIRSKEAVCRSNRPLGGALSAARAVQLFGRMAVIETHTLWYFGHHCCLVVGSHVLGIWHFWIFTPFHPFLPFSTHFVCAHIFHHIHSFSTRYTAHTIEYTRLCITGGVSRGYQCCN